jgi:hypothetical protein
MIKSLTFPFLLLFLLCSCYTIYTPNELQIPLHQKQGEFTAKGMIGIMYNGFSSNFDRILDTTQDYKFPHQESSSDYAVGYYSGLNNSGSLLFEVYGGYGNGRVRDNINSDRPRDYPPSSNTNSKIFIQGNIGLKLKNFEVALSNRFSNVKLNNFLFVDSMYRQTNIHYWEPNVVIKFGGKNVKITYQGGISQITSRTSSVFYQYEEIIRPHTGTLHATIGLEIQLNRKLKK